MTSTRRESNVNDLSLAITAFSGNNLQNLGVIDARDLQNLVPGLNIQKGAFNVSSPQISIRGVGNTFFNGNAVATVGIYLDEVYLNSTVGHGLHLYDLDRVEVLRGPQGTLYGGNATGGAISFVSRKPQVGEELSGNFRATIGSFGEQRFEGAVGLSISDNTAVRFSATSNASDGTRDNLFLQQDSQFFETFAWRAQLLFEPSDTVSLLIRAHQADNKSDGPQYEIVGRQDPTLSQTWGFPAGRICADDLIATGACAGWGGYVDSVSSPGFHDGQVDREGADDVDVSGADVTIRYDIGETTLTSITAFVESDRYVAEDLDGTPLDVFRETWDSRAEQFSQEFRLGGNTDSLDWIVGAFFLRDETIEYKDFFYGDFVDPAVDFGSDPLLHEGDFFSYELESKNIALFADVTYAISDSFSLSGGIRYSDEEKEVPRFERFIWFSDGIPVATRVNEALARTRLLGAAIEDASGSKESWSEMTGRIALEYRPNDTLLTYLSFSNGFRSGNIKTSGQNNSFGFLEPETIDSVELGAKASLWDGRAQLNVAAFSSDYEDQQLAGVSDRRLAQLNAPSASISGGEVELTLQPNDDFFAYIGISVLDAEFGSFIADAVGGADFTGNKLEQAPELTVNGLISYQWQVGKGQMRFQSDFAYKDDHYLTFQNFARSLEEAYTLVGASLTYEVEQLQFSIWGKNIGDEEYRTNQFGSNFLGADFDSTGTPATYGFSFGVEF